MRRFALYSVLGCMLVSRVGSADEAAPSANAADKSVKAEPAAADGVRRDPKGVQGVSPMWEAIAQGDSAVLARNYDAATAAYREAITKSPQDPLAHYRMGQAQALKGDFKEAEAAYQSALRFAAKDSQLKGKVLFCLASLSERQKAWEQALERWTAYEGFAKTAEKAKLFPASAAERKKRILEWKQITTDSAAVKERIEKRLKEGEESVRRAPITKG